MKGVGALTSGMIEFSLNIPYKEEGDREKKHKDYDEQIKNYVGQLTEDWKHEGKDLFETVRLARNELAKHIHKKYREAMPYWPERGRTNERDIELNIKHSYESGINIVIINL